MKAAQLNRPSLSVKKPKRHRIIWPAAPLSIWLLIFLVAPFIMLLLFSVWQVVDFALSPTFTLGNYAQFLGDATSRTLLYKTGMTAVYVGLLSAIMGYLVALFIRQCPRAWQRILFMAILAPLWVDYLTRIYSWQIILGEHGILNMVLLHLHFISAPSTFFFYNRHAVILVMVSVTLPFAFIPAYSALEKIPNNLSEAAQDLGASSWNVFRTVIFPLSLPGIATGFSLAFIYSFGDYLTPSLVGGTTGMMLGNVIESEFGIFNWPLGAAMSLVLFFIILLVVGLVSRIGNVEGVLEE